MHILALFVGFWYFRVNYSRIGPPFKPSVQIARAKCLPVGAGNKNILVTACTGFAGE